MQTTVSQVDMKLQELIEIVERLRAPGGCPWDRAQKKGDVGRYLIEEAYEVIEALDESAPEGLKEELGDLLFQIIFLAKLAEEAAEFDTAAVIDAVREKMIRRHPHVFGDAEVNGIADVRRNWEMIKKETEHKERKETGICEGVPASLSALARTQLATAKAAEVGFDWKDASGVLDKLEEEVAEFKAAMAAGDDEQMKEEVGDLLFTLVNLCRFAQVDAEAALRRSLKKFSRRFADMERELAARGKTPAGSSLAEMDLIWNMKKGAPPEK